MSEALLVIDVQRALLDELPPARRGELLATLEPLLQRARAGGVPVVYVRHDGSPAELLPGTPEWNIGSEISPLEGEPVVDKRFGDAFQETNLSDVLAAIGADHLIVTGMQTDYCVRATIAGAADRGFRVTLVADAHATNPSNGKTEQQISEELYADWLARGVAIVSASDLARIGVSHT